MGQSSEILTDHCGGVLLVTLNRPTRLNAFTRAMCRQYRSVLEQADEDPGVRAIVLTGAGDAFCAGSDLAELDSHTDDLDSFNDAPAAQQPTSPLTPHPPLQTPMVAAINGTTAGAGLAAALFATVRFAAEDAMITTAFCKNGLLSEQGVGWLLPTLTGIDTGLEVLMHARALSGKDACDIGLVDRALPRDRVLDAAVNCARSLATTGQGDHE